MPALLWTALAGAAQALPHPRGWEASGSSLLLFDERGSVVREIGLGRFSQDPGGDLILEHAMIGGTSSDGRFAWHWHKDQTLRRGYADAVVASTSSLAYLGTSGQTLWDSSSADAPEGLAPVVQSKDGESALLVERGPAGWTVSAVTFTGKVLARVGPMARLEKIYLTGNGWYAMALGGGQESSLYYSFLNLRNGTRKDVLAADAPLGVERIEEDGSVRSGRKTVFRFR